MNGKGGGVLGILLFIGVILGLNLLSWIFNWGWIFY
jgi:hypothetical protein